MTQPDTFAFIIHPIDTKGDVARKYPLLGKILTPRMIDLACTFWPPVYISEIEGVRSQDTAKEVGGWFVAAPYTPRRMLELPVEMVYKKIVATGRLAENLGAKILGLGAFTSVVGDAGMTIARRLDIPVTTGDAYTIFIAVDAVRQAGRMMGHPDLKNTTAAVVGATGSIGSTCSELLAHDVGKLILIGRRTDALQVVREKCETGSADLQTTTSLDVLKEADLILSVSSAVGAIIEPRHLKPGAVICDVARPRDVSRAVARERDDVLVIEGGMVQVPGPANFNFNFGFPPGRAYACMAETMALTLEGHFADYTLGKDIQIERVREITEIATRHGFKLSGLRSFEREVTEEHIARVRQRARDALQTRRPGLALT